MPPVALNGATVTIRKFPEDPWTIEKLVAIGSLTQEAADFLECLVRAKYNIFVSGGTGTGKTTFLNALSNFIPKDERIITIEDSAELQIKGIANLVRLETKNASLEGKGQITIRDLIKSSLRMRPERIVVGEVRGPEALDMLQAMNTGHDGSSFLITWISIFHHLNRHVLYPLGAASPYAAVPVPPPVSGSQQFSFPPKRCNRSDYQRLGFVYAGIYVSSAGEPEEGKANLSWQPQSSCRPFFCS